MAEFLKKQFANKFGPRYITIQNRQDEPNGSLMFDQKIIDKWSFATQRFT